MNRTHLAAMNRRHLDDVPTESEIRADENPTPPNPRINCRVCGAGFISRDLRDTHERTCTGDDPWLLGAA